MAQPSKQHFIDLAQERLGGKALACSDDFFASMHNLIKPGRGDAIPGYNDNGKIMDGWESRRKRVPGFDWCIVRLGCRGRIHQVDIDTNLFTGNYPEYASLEAIALGGGGGEQEEQQLRHDDARWVTILSSHKLGSSCQNIFQIPAEFHGKEFTHVKLNIYPDGGVARLKVYGLVSIDPAQLNAAAAAGSGGIDLALASNGGRAFACSDEHYGTMHNLTLPGRGINMGDGWETRRRRGAGFDWVVLRLGATCTKLDHIVVDTAHFKGNYPDECSLEVAYLDERDEVLLGCMTSCGWTEVLPRRKLQAHTEHAFDGKDLKITDKPFNFVRLCIYPDGGVSRLRIFGTPKQQ